MRGTPLRAHSAIWLAIPSAILVVAYTSGVVATITEPGYWLAIFTKVGATIGLVLPVCALSGAWEGSRARRAAPQMMAPVRSPFTIALHALWPTWILGLLAIALAVAVNARFAAGAPFRFPLTLWLVYLLLVVAHTAFGYLLALFIPRTIAIPLAVIVSYLWMGVPGTMALGWVHQLNGFNIWSCCEVEQDIAWQALVTPALLAAAMIAVVAGVIASVPTRRLRWIGGATAAAVAVAAGVAIAVPIGQNAAQPRAGEPTCEGHAPTICLWPEQRRPGVDYDTVLRSAYRDLTNSGIALPSTLTAASNAEKGSVFVSPRPGLTDPTDLRMTLASSLVPEQPACPITTTFDPLGISYALLGQKAGVPLAEIAPRFGPETTAAVNALETQSQDEQQRWLRQTMRAFSDCSASFPKPPGQP